MRRLSDRQRWVIQPLLEVGLDMEQIGGLVYGLAFGALTTDGRPPVTTVGSLVAAQSTRVQSAWLESISRMTIRDEDAQHLGDLVPGQQHPTDLVAGRVSGPPRGREGTTPGASMPFPGSNRSPRR